MLEDADAVILSALVPGEIAPILITDEMVASMRSGSVIVDVSIDQEVIVLLLSLENKSPNMMSLWMVYRIFPEEWPFIQPGFMQPICTTMWKIFSRMVILNRILRMKL